MDIKSFHKELHSDYTSYRSDTFHLFKVYEIIKKLIKKNKIKKVMEIGCSDCSFGQKLKEDFKFDMEGMDIAEGAIKSCASKGIKAILHDLEKPIPIKDETYDMVLFCEVIEHIFDTDFVLKEINRILKKTGFLILTTHNVNSLSNRIRILLGKYPTHCEYSAEGSGHIRVYNFPVLINQLKKNNYNIIKVSSPNFPFPVKNKKIPFKIRMFMVKLGDLFPRLSNQSVIVAMKK